MRGARRNNGNAWPTIEPLRIIQDQILGLARSAAALVPNLIAALLALALTFAIAAGITRLVARLLRRTRTRPSLQSAMVTLIRIAVWVFGLLVAATILFPNLTPTKLLAGLGLGSIAIGLAFKDIFENFLAGILILIRQPMRIGDDIECEDISGRVEEISIRDTYVRKRSGELILVPNSYLYKNPTRILTDHPKRRIDLTVGVAYGEDVDAARDVIRNAVEGLATVDADQRIDVFAKEFNSSSIDFMVRWWAGSTPIDEHRSRDQAVTAIKAALDTAGIEIPFPYRTLNFKEPLSLRNLPDGDMSGPAG
jgi:small-conductance mechanosensitive channel